MSAQPTVTTPAAAPEGHVNIEIDGVAMHAPKGSMIIHAADKAGIPIPRFCYHDKLPIAANCRMCLVDVEKSPKPAPACATPVMEGMKVYTQTKRALDSQRNVMEFLLINHPLDCPICDQGGECELQDVAMGYGRSVSRFTENKRVVADENLGPLVASDMTRCIQCTRCVRFTSEIAGTYDLGGMGRGDRLEIGTYIGKAIQSEMSGNVIDVCPVGALTNKPFRFRARAWELIARESIATHDALGSNLWMHLRRGEVLRTVPRDNESINESWLSDRDRYSHAGLNAEDRLSVPMIRRGEQWQEASWNEAIAYAAELIRAQSGDDVGVLAHPATSNEEGSLLAALASGIGSGNLDHRISLADLTDAPVANVFEMPVAEVEQADVIVLIGSNPRHEAPLLGHRIRKAQRTHGAKVIAINPIDFDFNFDVAIKHILTPNALVDAVLNMGQAAGAFIGEETAATAIAADEAATLVATLRDAQRAVIIVGEAAQAHAQSSWLRRGAQVLATAVGAKLNLLPIGANAIGLSAHGVLPSARNAIDMLAQPRKAYVLYGIESAHDFADQPLALRAFSQAEGVVALTAFADEVTRKIAKVMLPIGLTQEIDASYTNVDGVTQSVVGAAKLPGQALAGWRVLRALGEALNVKGFNFVDLPEYRATMNTRVHASGTALSKRVHVNDNALELIATRATYRIDALLRRAAPLAAHPINLGARIVVNPTDAKARGLEQGAIAKVDDGRGVAALPVAICTRVPSGAAWIEKGYDATAPIAATGSSVTVARA